MDERELIKELSQGEKICPLRSMLAEPSYCFRENCAFWDEENNNCAILSVCHSYKIIKEIVLAIDELLANMHEVLDNLNNVLKSLAEEDYYAL